MFHMIRALVNEWVNEWMNEWNLYLLAEVRKSKIEKNEMWKPYKTDKIRVKMHNKIWHCVQSI